MLGEKYRELLTAYVDGELSARQRRMVQKLLRKSPEARELLRRLQADSNALINLPPPASTPDVTPAIMQTISQRGLKPPRRPMRAPQTISLRTALAAAAAVLLVVGAASFVFISAISSDRRDPVAHRKKDSQGSKPNHLDRQIKPDEKPELVKKPEPEKKLEPKKPDDIVKGTEKKPEPEKPKDPEKKQEPEKPEDLLGAPVVERFELNTADVAVPSLFKLKDLALESTRKSFAKELTQADAYYIEVLCKEATHAFPRLQDAFKASKIELVTDRTANERLRNPAIKSNYGIYFEDVTPEELAKLLELLGVDDSKGDKKKPSVGQFLSNDANLMVCAMTSEHRKRLIGLLGVDPRQEKTLGPRGVDLKKPLSEQTTDQVLGALANEKPRSGEHQAIAMAYVPMGGKSPSPEVKSYLDARKPARKGTIQVLLVLRGRP